MESCCYCLKDYQKDELRTIKRCKHVFCCRCLVEYFKNFSIEKLKCLIKTCNSKLTDRIIRECLSNRQIQAYEQISMSCSQNLIKCLTEGCMFMVICSEELVFQCDFCMAPNCIKCKQRHYVGECDSTTVKEDAIEARARDALKERSRLEFKELEYQYHLIPNPESFTCPICKEFILPRMGVILRKCLHYCCEDCLTGSISAKKFLSHMTCPIENCNTALDPREIFVIVNEVRLSKMMIKEAASRFFQCKNGDCVGMWDMSSEKGFYSCPQCHETNCLDCKDIHDKMTCREFRRTKRYIASQDQYRILNQNEGVKCYRCTRLLIRRGGCAAMYCDHCGSQTCLFTGKIPGPHLIEKCKCGGSPKCSEIKLYCGCVPERPCDRNCLHGCFPENPI